MGPLSSKPKCCSKPTHHPTPVPTRSPTPKPTHHPTPIPSRPPTRLTDPPLYKELKEVSLLDWVV